MRTRVFGLPERVSTVLHLDYDDPVIVISPPITGDGRHLYSQVIDASGTVGYVYMTNIVMRKSDAVGISPR